MFHKGIKLQLRYTHTHISVYLEKGISHKVYNNLKLNGYTYISIVKWKQNISFLVSAINIDSKSLLDENAGEGGVVVLFTTKYRVFSLQLSI